MTILQYDLTKITRGYLAHGVNCQGVMGAGFAKALAQTYPNLSEYWSTACMGPQRAKVGRCYPFKATDALTIYNLTTQEYYGKMGRASLDWVRASVRELETLHDTLDPVFMPPIGSGLGGLNWQEVKDIFRLSTVPFLVCDLVPKPKQVPSDVAMDAAWLELNRGGYQGQWVVLQDGQCLSAFEDQRDALIFMANVLRECSLVFC